MTDLPLRIAETPGGYVIRCLCGAESATVKASAEPAGAIVRAARGSAVANRGISPDVSPAAVLRMALHAKRCLPARNRALESP